MVDTLWKERLALAVERSGLSLRAASLKSGHGSSYLHGVMTMGKEPSLVSLGKVADALGVSATWLAYGVELDAPTEKLLSMYQSLSPEEQDNILFLTENMAKKRPADSE